MRVHVPWDRPGLRAPSTCLNSKNTRRELHFQLAFIPLVGEWTFVLFIKLLLLPPTGTTTKLPMPLKIETGKLPLTVL